MFWKGKGMDTSLCQWEPQKTGHTPLLLAKSWGKTFGVLETGSPRKTLYPCPMMNVFPVLCLKGRGKGRERKHPMPRDKDPDTAPTDS